MIRDGDRYRGHGLRIIHGLLIGLTIVLAACSGSPTGGSSAPTTAASSASATPPSAAASTTASSSPAAGAVDLPAECVEAIRVYLVAVEPIVKDVQWTTMIGTPPEVEDQLAEVAATVDPDACPELPATEAHDAWIAIAFDAAPGTLDYIDFVYRP
jgi:hypothetical protein